MDRWADHIHGFDDHLRSRPLSDQGNDQFLHRSWALWRR